MPPDAVHNRWLHRYAVLTALGTLALIAIGGVVTSKGAGMAVPDWPTTYGYNMFFFPFSYWMGGIFYEHSHRLIASIVGLLVVGLTRWLGGSPARMPLAIIGALEVVGGLLLLQLGPEWKGAGHFLSGIGGVVLLGALVWAKNAPAAGILPLLGWVAFFAVQFQGLLGGLRVVLYKNEIGVFHASLAQLFFVLVCAIALLTSRHWQQTAFSGESSARPLRYLVLGATAMIFVQLLVGAMMRHQHAGLAIPDFPLAYGELWPGMDADSIARYNQQRIEVTAANPITAFQVGLQMVHRLMAVAVVFLVAAVAWRARQGSASAGFARGAYAWAALIGVQALLGAATVWSNKAADIATGHVIGGALSLALGAMLTIVSWHSSARSAQVCYPPANVDRSVRGSSEPTPQPV